tara:strand:+ start:161 stop:511 length:351 start_codon:yes stop_codon:yes gene_type:complete
MEDKNNLNIDLDNEEITDETKNEMKESSNIHIHKTDDEGKEVDIDIDKNKKTVNVNVNKDKDGKKTNVKIGISGLKVIKDGNESVNIHFWPIFLFFALIICGFFFLIYKVIELFVK